MISEIRGRVLRVFDGRIVLDVNGVGFDVNMGSGRARSFSPGQEVRLFTRLILREDGLSLYGFENEDERAVFDLLLTVRGIGPKQASSLAAHLQPGDFYGAVLSGNEAVLAKCPGVGRKTASRILVELKDKIQAQPGFTLPQAGGRRQSLWDDALEGLMALGYTREEVDRVLEDMKREGKWAELEAVLREALRRIARRR